METILLHQVTKDDFFERLRTLLKEEIKLALQQDQLLTKEGALKMAGISNATFMKAINEGVVKPQLVKGRKKAMYLESEVLKVENLETFDFKGVDIALSSPGAKVSAVHSPRAAAIEWPRGVTDSWVASLFDAYPYEDREDFGTDDEPTVGLFALSE